jgi:glycosyltransferase involved in cell wall biosynthesis
MKIAFFSPYIPKHTGGGEKYLFDCALLAAEAGHQVFLAISSAQALDATEVAKIRNKYEQFLDCSLISIEFIASPLFTEANFLQKLMWTKQFDCLYYQTDGSLFFSLAKKNILHIQVPLPLDKSGLIERLKLANWSIKNSNSFFTKKYIEKFWQTKIDFVHQPYVDLSPTPNKVKKEKIILAVGRFFCQLHSKRQDVLVDLFRQLAAKDPATLKGWRLILIGKKEDEEFARKVEEKIGDLPVTLLHETSRSELIAHYQSASIFWHATGYGIDENIEPEKAEHFGISTVEAMAAGVVPVVINKGGQKEILGEELGECLWNDETDCLAKTLSLIKNKDRLNILAKQARERSQEFSKEKFRKILLTMLDK